MSASFDIDKFIIYEDSEQSEQGGGGNFIAIFMSLVILTCIVQCLDSISLSLTVTVLLLSQILTINLGLSVSDHSLSSVAAHVLYRITPGVSEPEGHCSTPALVLTCLLPVNRRKMQRKSCTRMSGEIK